MIYVNVWLHDLWCHKVTELKAGVLTGCFRSSFFLWERGAGVDFLKFTTFQMHMMIYIFKKSIKGVFNINVNIQNDEKYRAVDKLFLLIWNKSAELFAVRSFNGYNSCSFDYEIKLFQPLCRKRRNVGKRSGRSSLLFRDATKLDFLERKTGTTRSSLWLTHAITCIGGNCSQGTKCSHRQGTFCWGDSVRSRWKLMKYWRPPRKPLDKSH